MGSQKAYKYYCLIFLFFLTSCGISVREYKLNSLKDESIKISVVNKTHEPNITSLFTKTIEERLIKRGAKIVDNNENYEVVVFLADIKNRAVSYTSSDIVGAYVIQIIGSYSIKEKNKNTPVATGVFNISNNYNIRSIVDSEIERANALKKSANEIAESIYGKLAILPQKF